MVTNDLHTKLEGGRAQISKLEVLSKLSFDVLDLCLGLGGQGDVIDKDRDNHLGTLMVPNKDRGIQANSGEAQAQEYLLQTLKPAASTLLQTIEAFGQLGDPFSSLLSKAFRLCHVDVDILELAIEVGVGDVDGLKLQVLKSGNGKNRTQSSPLGGRCKGLVKVNAWSL
jgi:hypothetical protein